MLKNTVHLYDFFLKESIFLGKLITPTEYLEKSGTDNKNWIF